MFNRTVCYLMRPRTSWNKTYTLVCHLLLCSSHWCQTRHCHTLNQSSPLENFWNESLFNRMHFSSAIKNALPSACFSLCSWFCFCLHCILNFGGWVHDFNYHFHSIANKVSVMGIRYVVSVLWLMSEKKIRRGDFLEVTVWILISFKRH